MNSGPIEAEAELLSELRLLVLTQLRDVLARGRVDGNGPVDCGPAPAPYFTAAIRVLKDSGALGGTNEPPLDSLLAALPTFDDEA